MNIVLPLWFFALFATSSEAQSKDGWIYQGTRKCIFYQNMNRPKPTTTCAEYVRKTNYKIGSTTVASFRYKWIMGRRFEVRYRPTVGIVGVSNFTSGEIYDKTAPFSGHAVSNALSYSPNRDELVIGTVDSGYIFSVNGPF